MTPERKQLAKEIRRRLRDLHPGAREYLKRILDRIEDPDPPEYKPAKRRRLRRKRTEFTQLMPAHLYLVDAISNFAFLPFGEEYNRDLAHDYLLQNYDSLFGPLRAPGMEVPSDQFRKSLMVIDLLDQVESRLITMMTVPVDRRNWYDRRKGAPRWSSGT